MITRRNQWVTNFQTIGKNLNQYTQVTHAKNIENFVLKFTLRLNTSLIQELKNSFPHHTTS